MDRPVAVVGVAHRRRQKSMDNHQGRGVCRSTPMTLGLHGNSVSNLWLWVENDRVFSEIGSAYLEWPMRFGLCYGRREYRLCRVAGKTV